MAPNPSTTALSFWARWLSRFMAISGLVVMLVSAWAVVFTLSDPGWIAGWLASTQPELQGVALAAWQGNAILLAAAPQVIAFLLASYAGWLGFAHIADRQGIDEQAALWLRRAGLGFASSSLAMLLSHPLLSAIVSLGMPEGKRFISLSIGTPELMTLIVSMTMLVFAHVLKLAVEIERDNRLIV